MRGSNNGRARRRQRRSEAAERQAARDARSPAEQLERLESRGFGKCREAHSLRRFRSSSLRGEIEAN